MSFTAIPVAETSEAAFQEALVAAAKDYDRTPEMLAERMLARGTPFGTPEKIRSRLAKLEILGISRLYLQARTTDPAELEARIAPYLP